MNILYQLVKKELFLIPSNLIVYKKVAIIYETVIYYTWL